MPAEVSSYFAAAERCDDSVILRLFRRLEEDGRITEILDAAPNIVMVVNHLRQILFANRQLQELLGLDLPDIRGQRPGELLRCPNAKAMPGGCGTAPGCRYCGLVNVILDAFETGAAGSRDARLLVEGERRTGARDLRVHATPIRVDDQMFMVVYVDDISPAKARERLERTFFHDVLNTVGGLRNLASFLNDAPREDVPRISRLIRDQVDVLLDEIRDQRVMSRAEDATLAVHPEQTDTLVLFSDARSGAASLREARGRRIESRKDGVSRPIRIDSTLARRVLVNMLKNALEATPSGGRVLFSMEHGPDAVLFRVWNEAVMSEDVRRQVFQRSFSTKGPGRGSGTYGMRLLTEDYLGGSVDFVSESPNGTEFRAAFPYDAPA